MEMIPGDRYSLIDSEGGPVNESMYNSCDIAIIAGKADSTSVLSSIAEDIVSDRGFVVSIQNGIGNAGIIASRVGHFWMRPTFKQTRTQVAARIAAINFDFYYT